MTDTEIDDLKNNNGNKDDSNGDNLAAQFHNNNVSKGCVDGHTDAPRQEAHGSSSTSNDNKSSLLIELHALIEGQHQGEHNQICSTDSGRQHTNGSQNHGHSHNCIDVHLTLGQTEHGVTHGGEEAGLGQETEVKDGKDDHQTGRLHRAIELCQEEIHRLRDGIAHQQSDNKGTNHQCILHGKLFHEDDRNNKDDHNRSPHENRHK